MTDGHLPIDPFADLPPTDLNALERLRRFGGGKLLGEMIALFLVAAPERIAAAASAVAADDHNAAELALHSLKSSSAQLGAVRMQRLSAEGEQLAQSAALGDAERVVRDLQEEFVRVRDWLITVRDGGTAA